MSRMGELTKGHMNLDQFRDLLNYIEAKHSFRKAQGKMIKYVTPTCDMRTGSIFHINLRRAGNGKDFAVINENKDRDLEAWIYDWLANGSWNSDLVDKLNSVDDNLRC